MYDLKGGKKLLSSTEDKPIFENLEGSRPRPRPWTWFSRPRTRTSKTALVDVLEAASSGLRPKIRVCWCHYDVIFTKISSCFFVKWILLYCLSLLLWLELKSQTWLD